MAANVVIKGISNSKEEDENRNLLNPNIEISHKTEFKQSSNTRSFYSVSISINLLYIIIMRIASMYSSTHSRA